MEINELLKQRASKNCECVDNEEGIRCDACLAASALNECSEIMNDAWKEINNRQTTRILDSD